MKAVIFDFDDTLVQTQTTKVAKVQYVTKKYYGVDLDKERILQEWGKPQQEFFANLLGEVAFDYDEMLEKYLLEDAYPNLVYAGAEGLLSDLQELFVMGLVSSASRRLVLEDLKATGLGTEWFAFVQGAEDTQAHKPDPRVFDPMLERLADSGIGRGDCVYVGDSLRDYEAARDAGMSFVGIHDRTTSREQFGELGAESVGTFEELKKKLLGELY